MTGSYPPNWNTVPLRVGSLTWLPRRSRRQFAAVSDGLRYLTVHKRRPAPP